MTDFNYDDTDKRLTHAFLQFHNLYRFGKVNEKRKSLEECEKRHMHLKYSEYLLLFYIRSAMELKPDGVSASELSVTMNVKPPTINPLLSNLENHKLIERRTDQNDRRFVMIVLTPDGLNFTHEHEEKLFKRVHGLASYLGENKSNKLAELMNDVYNYFKSEEI